MHLAGRGGAGAEPSALVGDGVAHIAGHRTDAACAPGVCTGPCEYCIESIRAWGQLVAACITGPSGGSVSVMAGRIILLVGDEVAARAIVPRAVDYVGKLGIADVVVIIDGDADHGRALDYGGDRIHVLAAVLAHTRSLLVAVGRRRGWNRCLQQW